MERKNMLELMGYKVETIWGCEWDKIKETLPNKNELEAKAKQQKAKAHNNDYNHSSRKAVASFMAKDHGRSLSISVNFIG